jgi:hypothetical protein
MFRPIWGIMSLEMLDEQPSGKSLCSAFAEFLTVAKTDVAMCL